MAMGLVGLTIQHLPASDEVIELEEVLQRKETDTLPDTTTERETHDTNSSRNTPTVSITQKGKQPISIATSSGDSQQMLRGRDAIRRLATFRKEPHRKGEQKRGESQNLQYNHLRLQKPQNHGVSYFRELKKKILTSGYTILHQLKLMENLQCKPFRASVEVQKDKGITTERT